MSTEVSITAFCADPMSLEYGLDDRLDGRLSELDKKISGYRKLFAYIK
jgi:hypothetical protein